MVMRIGAFELNEPLPELNEPHALAMLEPWIDAGRVGTMTASWLEARFGAKDLAKLARPGSFFDFTRYRPSSYFKEGRRQVIIPNTYITYGKSKAGNDFLFLRLLEPHSHSEVYVESVLRLLARFGTKKYCLFGSMYDFVPYTKPLLVTGGAVGEKAEQELVKLGIESSNYQGPTTITYLVSQRAPDMGMETTSLIVHLPQYAQLDEDYIGTVCLMKLFGALYDIPPDESYIRKAEEQLGQINLALESNPQLRATIEQLETHYEERAKRRKQEETPRLSPEIERFLSEMNRRFREG